MSFLFQRLKKLRFAYYDVNIDTLDSSESHVTIGYNSAFSFIGSGYVQRIKTRVLEALCAH